MVRLDLVISTLRDITRLVEKSYDSEVVSNYISLLEKYENMDQELKDNTVKYLFTNKDFIDEFVKCEKMFDEFRFDPFLMSVLIITGVIQKPKLVKTFICWLWYCDSSVTEYNITTFKNIIHQNGLINNKQLLSEYHNIELLWKD